MTFDEMIKKVLNNENYNTDGLSVDDVITLIEVLRLEYAPTVEMTKEDINNFRFYLENSNFFSLIERNHAVIESEMLGITEGVNEFLDLSDEDLMQAWLHLETIKVVGENND